MPITSLVHEKKLFLPETFQLGDWVIHPIACSFQTTVTLHKRSGAEVISAWYLIDYSLNEITIIGNSIGNPITNVPVYWQIVTDVDGAIHIADSFDLVFTNACETTSMLPKSGTGPFNVELGSGIYSSWKNAYPDAWTD